MTLGRFGHHPDPAIDLCVEIDAIEGLAADVKAGLEPKKILEDRIFNAMTFRVGGIERAVAAKGRLRELERAI